MMKSEFCERTGLSYESIGAEEYRIIESVYYDYPGNKDEYCRAWLDWKKSGAWEIMRQQYYHIEYWQEECKQAEQDHIKTLHRVKDILSDDLYRGMRNNLNIRRVDGLDD